MNKKSQFKKQFTLAYVDSLNAKSATFILSAIDKSEHEKT